MPTRRASADWVSPARVMDSAAVPGRPAEVRAAACPHLWSILTTCSICNSLGQFVAHYAACPIFARPILKLSCRLILRRRCPRGPLAARPSSPGKPSICPPGVGRHLHRLRAAHLVPSRLAVVGRSCRWAATSSPCMAPSSMKRCMAIPFGGRWLDGGDRLSFALALAAIRRLSRQPSDPSPGRATDLPPCRSGIELRHALHVGSDGAIPPPGAAAADDPGRPSDPWPALCHVARHRALPGRDPRRQSRSAAALAGAICLAVALVLIWVMGICHIPLWQYLLLYVYPGLSLTLLRSFAEHRAAVPMCASAPSPWRPIRSWRCSTPSTILARPPSRRAGDRLVPPSSALSPAARRSSTRPMAAMSLRAIAQLFRRYLFTAKEPAVHPFAGQGFPL